MHIPHFSRSRILFIISKRVAIVTYKLSGTPKSPEEIRERALRYVGKKDYNPLLRNCEHFATWCVYGKALSGQVRAGVMGAATAATTAAGGGVGTLIGGAIGSVLPGAGTVAGAAIGGAIGAGVGGVVGLVGAGLGWVITHVVYEVKEESEEFE